MQDVENTEPVAEQNVQENAASGVQEQAPARLPRVVIVGAGFGGLRAAKALANAPVSVTVIDRNNHHLFQPLLYWVATAGLSPAEISSPIRHILRKQKNTEVVMAEVTGIDTQGQRVLMHEREIPYDYLLLATGAQDNYFGHTEWSTHAPGLKSIVEATAIRSRILQAFEVAEIEPDPEKVRELLTFVLVGAGPTGVEMAGAIAELAHKALARDFRHIDPISTRVILIEASPRILSAFPEKLAKKAQKALNRLGVEIRTGIPVENIDASGVSLDGQHIASRTIIWCAGVAASPAGKWLGAEVDRGGRVKINADLSVPGHPEIFVIGDTATAMQNGKPLPGVAPVAMQQGSYVARLIKQRVTTGGGEQPFHYIDKGSLATIGRSYAIVDLKGLRITGLLAWVLWLVIHIYYLIGFRNRLFTLIQWAWTYFTYNRGARLITANSKYE
ncbi:MAG TPA: NAD(P)/FAD-dependent oxidoreductase [Ktedonobacteraceae bacterium]|nr:NAD(P)/FAD-dependent oxidoreductase [Ktedonobacteraceae bacterium]